jgi:hypothetical protein
MPRGGHAERALQASWRQEHGAAHAGGPRAQQASKLETRALFEGSQGGTVARPGCNTCAPQSTQLNVSGCAATISRLALECMMAAQLRCHNAAMDCYRCAMLREQTFAGRREALNQANRLPRTYATLLDALNRHRGKGQQKVTVEHVHVHEAVTPSSAMSRAGGGERSHRRERNNPMHLPMHQASGWCCGLH